MFKDTIRPASLRVCLDDLTPLQFPLSICLFVRSGILIRVSHKVANWTKPAACVYKNIMGFLSYVCPINALQLLSFISGACPIHTLQL